MGGGALYSQWVCGTFSLFYGYIYAQLDPPIDVGSELDHPASYMAAPLIPGQQQRFPIPVRRASRCPSVIVGLPLLLRRLGARYDRLPFPVDRSLHSFYHPQARTGRLLLNLSWMQHRCVRSAFRLACLRSVPPGFSFCIWRSWALTTSLRHDIKPGRGPRRTGCMPLARPYFWTQRLRRNSRNMVMYWGLDRCNWDQIGQQQVVSALSLGPWGPCFPPECEPKPHSLSPSKKGQLFQPRVFSHAC